MPLIDKLKTIKPQIEALLIPEWETTIYVRAMTFGERQANSHECREARDSAKDLSSATMVIKFTQDENGKPLFTMQDLPELEKMDGDVLDRIAVKVFQLTAKKNSPTTSDESADSPRPSA